VLVRRVPGRRLQARAGRPSRRGWGGAAPAGMIAYWAVDDVEAAYRRLLTLGATEHQAPRDFGEGVVGGSVVDPFGNILSVMYNAHYLDVRGQIPPFELPKIERKVL
jgi:uncharacterized glyoxalase superfamily protein PhnB